MEIFRQSWALLKSAMFDQNRWLTPLEMCKFFYYGKMTVLSSKKPPFEITKSSNDKTKVSFTENWVLMKSGMFDQNRGLTPLEICKFFYHSKTTFLSSKKSPFRKKGYQTTKLRSPLQKTRLKRNVEVLTRTMG